MRWLLRRLVPDAALHVGLSAREEMRAFLWKNRRERVVTFLPGSVDIAGLYL